MRKLVRHPCSLAASRPRLGQALAATQVGQGRRRLLRRASGEPTVDHVSKGTTVALELRAATRCTT